jgi:hypothetical protein
MNSKYPENNSPSFLENESKKTCNRVSKAQFKLGEKKPE